MTTPTPARTNPWLIVAVIGVLGFAFFAADVVFGEPSVSDCCAAESGTNP